MAITKASNSGIKTGVLKYDSMLAGNAAYEPSSVDSIATTTLSTNTRSIEFTSIPGTYTHLQIRGIYQYSASDNLEMTINSGTNISRTHRLYGDGSSVTAGSEASNIIAPQTGTSTTDFYGIIIDILDYANTNKNKTLRILGGLDRNGSGIVWMFSALYATTSAITSIKLQPGTHNLTTNTKFALYGIKAVS